jgi:hypothetical protein
MTVGRRRELLLIFGTMAHGNNKQTLYGDPYQKKSCLMRDERRERSLMCDYIYARAPFTCAERVSVQAGVNTCIRCECSDTLGARPPSGSETHCALRAPPRLMSLSHKPPSRRALSFAKSETWENICRRERARL